MLTGDGQRIAFLIGNHKFLPEAGLAPLPGVPNDLIALNDVLGHPELGGFKTRTFLDRHSGEIQEAIEKTLGRMGTADVLLIHYSGHGKLDRAGRLCLATTNTDSEALYTTSIPTQHLRDLVANSDCGAVVLTLDCCFSGAATNDLRGDVDSQLRALQEASGFYILAASSEVQTAAEAEIEQDGVLMGRFTAAIVEGIQGGVADLDQDGHISIYDLANYVKATVRYQTPQLYVARGSGNLMIARARPPATHTAVTRHFEEAALIDWYSSPPGRIRSLLQK
jgi:uncharacterized caspase-like protein